MTNTLIYKLHVEAFEDNCLHEQKTNDYKLFPLEFDHLVKTKLGIDVAPLEVRGTEELEFRYNQVSTFINRFLANHRFITKMEELNRATMYIELRDQRKLRVFVTNTYYFTEYSFNKVMAVDPGSDVIICSNPYGTYTNEVKRLCIESGIGLFTLGEFMGAVWKTGDDFLNSILKQDVGSRISYFERPLRKMNLPTGLDVFLFGSYLRSYLFQDIDVLIVYANEKARQEVDTVVELLQEMANHKNAKLDVTVCSSNEYFNLKLKHDNLTKIN
jgi:predicted nucleotidyltransferase